MSFDRFNFDADNGAILAFRVDGSAYVCLAEQVRHFSDVPDVTATVQIDDVIAALDRAWETNQNLFRRVMPKERVVAPSSGMAMELTRADRVRLHAIIDKHHKQYFADHPTKRQKDNLIDALGPQVAARIVKEALAKNSVH